MSREIVNLILGFLGCGVALFVLDVVFFVVLAIIRRTDPPK